MPSDRAQITYDEQKRYRSVVMQQGRVSLEADFNENVVLSDEEFRRVTRDVVGPTGTPDDGYGILALDATTRHVAITSGTMYVGGIRVSLRPVGRVESWLDLWSYAGQPDWNTPPPPNLTAAREIIWLELFEQEIGAVEDRAMREVALGGPDTAARTRIMQRIHRTAVTASNCADAFQELINQWYLEGYYFDPRTMRKLAGAMLAVSFEPPATPANPCDPTAAGGYLEADNQFLRVAITANDPVSAQRRLVWSYDNASFLYRVGERTSAGMGLKLGSRPVDDEHEPRPAQFAELLRGTARLGDDTVAAEPFGPIIEIAAYDADDQRITLVGAPPPEYLAADILYVRIWEAVVPFTDGQPVSLGATGVRVTPSSFGMVFPIGEYWTFAVRPGTPTVVYPERYLHYLQPPEGFRRWACPLAVIDWGLPSSIPPQSEQTAVATGDSLGRPGLRFDEFPRAPKKVTDCRERFDDLVTLSKRRGSCCIVVRPSDLERRTLQEIIDEHKGESGMTFCLTPGRYRLLSPLVLTHEHGAITIEGCGRGVIIESDSSQPFAPGMIHLLGTTGVRLCNLEFEAPHVTVTAIMAPLLPFFFGMRIGVRIIDAADCTIEECTFRFPRRPWNDPREPDIEPFFGAALAASGSLTECSFRNNVVTGFPDESRPIAGFVFTPALFKVPLLEPDLLLKLPPPQPRFRRCTLDGVRIEDNRFAGLSHAVLICAELREVAVRENSISDCGHGIIMMSSHWFPALAAANAEVIERISKSVTLDPAGKPIPNSGGVLTQEVARLQAEVLAPQMAVSALLLATHAALHPTIVVPLGAYATLPFPAGGETLSEPLGGIKTLQATDVLVQILGRYAALEQPFELAGFDEAQVMGDLLDAWKSGLFMPSDVELLQSNLALPFFDTAAVETTCDVSHNTVSRGNRGGLALLTLHDDGARIKPPNQPGAVGGVGWMYLNLYPGSGIQLKSAAVQNRSTTSSNDFRTKSRFFAAAMMLLERRCTVTGNVIPNEMTPQLHNPGTLPAEGSPVVAPNPVAIGWGTGGQSLPEFAPSLVVIPVPDRYVAATVGFVPDTVAQLARYGGFPLAQYPLLATTITGNSFTGWPILPIHTFRYYTVSPWLELNSIED
jgi:hypothetical protein